MKSMNAARMTLLKWMLFSSIVGLLHVETRGQGSSKAEPKARTSVPSNTDKAKAQQLRLEWNLRTLVDAYDKVGRKDPKWNEPARKALDTFARVRSGTKAFDEGAANLITTNCAAAVVAGCDDPMIAYLHARYVLTKLGVTARELGDAFRHSADALATSQYPEVRKFYASLRTAEKLNFGAVTNTPPEVHRFRHLAIDNLALALKDKSLPIAEVDEACNDIFQALKSNKEQYELCYQSIEKPLFQNWPEESVCWLLKGRAYLDMAWHGRGGGYANKVSDQGWKLFRERLAVAEAALGKAWQQNQTDERIPTLMIRVEEGQGNGRDRMELWFNRAMAINADNYQACAYKLHYLYPQWYGSLQDMVSFGKECADSVKWGGTVPLILSDAHREYALYLETAEARESYWKRPEVWPDVKVSFDRFFKLHPDAGDYYHNYAWYAYQCEQWEKLNELIPKLGKANYSYFGGREKFDKMVRLAKEHSAKSKGEEKK